MICWALCCALQVKDRPELFLRYKCASARVRQEEEMDERCSDALSRVLRKANPIAIWLAILMMSHLSYLTENQILNIILKQQFIQLTDTTLR